MIADVLEKADPIPASVPVSDIGPSFEMELIDADNAPSNVISVWVEQNTTTGRFESNGIRYELPKDSIPQFNKLQAAYTFTAVIDRFWKSGAQVTVTESDGDLSAETETSVDLSVNKNETFQAGDKIKVGYDDRIAETYPPQITTITVEKAD